MVTAAPLAPPTATLSSDQCRKFHDDGFLGPFPAVDRDEMLALADHCSDLCDEQHLAGANHNRHLDDAVVARIAEHPEIIGRVASLLGDVVLWRTNFFRKLPGGAEIPWHQDWNYWPLEAAVVVSAWIAIDDVDVENSAPQFIPGTHKRQIPHLRVPKGSKLAFGEMADPAQIDTTKAVDMVMRAGEFVLFNERTLHHSHENRSQRRRLGLALRYIAPITRVTDYDSAGPQPHVCRLVAGSDRLGFNRY